MGGGGKAAKIPSTSTIINSPPDWAVPNFREALRGAEELYRTGGPRLYPNATLADVPQEIKDALAGMEASARAGSPISQGATRYTADVLGGKYLPTNYETTPFFEDIVRRTAGNIASQVGSQYSAAGRYGSGSMAESMARGIGDTTANLRYTDYNKYLDLVNRERDRQTQVAAMAPEMYNLGYADLHKLSDVGESRRAFGQESINEAIKKWEMEQNRPFENLSRYTGTLSQMFPGGGGSSQTSTAMTPYFKQSPLQRGLGLGMTGLGLYNMMGGFGGAAGMGAAGMGAAGLLSAGTPASFYGLSSLASMAPLLI
jgi:hypothetical protein